MQAKEFIKRILNRIIVFAYNKKGIHIDMDCNVAEGVLLQPGVRNGVSGSLNVAGRCELSKGVVIKCYGGNVRIGQNTFLGEYVVIYGHGGIEIGQNTLIAMHTCIISSNHTVPDKNTFIRSQGDILLPVKIGNDVWIGAGAKILGGVTIGDGCVVGAGAVVTKNLPCYSIALGVPAQIKGYRNE